MLKSYIRQFKIHYLLMIALAQIMVRYCIIRSIYLREFLLPHMSGIEFLGLVIISLLIAGAGFMIDDILDRKYLEDQKGTDLDQIAEMTVNPRLILYFVLNIVAVGLGFLIASRVGYIKLGFIILAIPVLIWLYARKYKRMPVYGNIIAGFLAAFIILSVWLFEFFALRKEPSDFIAMMNGFKWINRFIWGYAGFSFLTVLLGEMLTDIRTSQDSGNFRFYSLPVKTGLPAARRITLSVILPHIYV